MDEATSNVDGETDAFIQQCIKREFKDATIITIAHRLSTVADYDKIVVLSSGEIVEIGSPSELLMKEGVFREMVQKTGSQAKAIEAQIMKGWFRLSKLMNHQHRKSFDDRLANILHKPIEALFIVSVEHIIALLETFDGELLKLVAWSLSKWWEDEPF